MVPPERDPARAYYDAAISGDATAIRQLTVALMPVVQARVARALLRRRAAARGRNVRQEVADFTQEVFLALFSREAKVLKAWDPGRGLSLANFVGLIAERETASILRSGRRSPWTEDPTLAEDLDDGTTGASPEAEVASRELLQHILDQLKARLSPKGMRLFQLLYLEERGVSEVAEETGMSHDALYAWRSRLAKQVREIGAQLMSDRDGIGRSPRQGET